MEVHLSKKMKEILAKPNAREILAAMKLGNNTKQQQIQERIVILNEIAGEDNLLRILQEFVDCLDDGYKPKQRKPLADHLIVVWDDEIDGG